MDVELLTAALMEPALGPAVPAQVLLCDTGKGLVLIDTGFGLADLADPAARLGPIRHLLRPRVDPSLTVVEQLRRRGIEAGAVTDIVLTHLDLDHMGGVDDFPEARVHTTADEYSAAVTDPDPLDRMRYRKSQLATLPRPVLHTGRGDVWEFGFTGHEVLPGVMLVPMPGHSRGHAAVAVAQDDRWILHAGDALFDASVLDPALPRRGTLRAFERSVGRDQRAISRNHRLLSELHLLPQVTVVLAHDDRTTL
ncbi:MBL fold metallo-hydrolase [Aeromicrobium piscarium]|uniref:MBL fold metallo-hydrolase n=1 Tax=Aeromicrobium piscarium TaxID=2590901 RepID=A0A554RHN1_9ACTN|nr:MBL fold metallo-hydrolase [Aeromicrobium piscarium]TSD53678.1 MBL fold metallo-hydrolase [Aeromicrobium piscarium]